MNLYPTFVKGKENWMKKNKIKYWKNSLKWREFFFQRKFPLEEERTKESWRFVPSLEGRKRATRALHETRVVDSKFWFFTARGDPSLSRSLTLLSFPPIHTIANCAPQNYCLLCRLLLLWICLLQKREEEKISHHPPTTPTRNSTSHHTVSWFAVVLTQPSSSQENKKIILFAFELVGLLSKLGSWWSIDRS